MFMDWFSNPESSVKFTAPNSLNNFLNISYKRASLCFLQLLWKFAHIQACWLWFHCCLLFLWTECHDGYHICEKLSLHEMLGRTEVQGFIHNLPSRIIIHRGNRLFKYVWEKGEDEFMEWLTQVQILPTHLLIFLSCGHKVSKSVVLIEKLFAIFSSALNLWWGMISSTRYAYRDACKILLYS